MAARTVDVCSHRVSRKGNSHSQIKNVGGRIQKTCPEIQPSFNTAVGACYDGRTRDAALQVSERREICL